MDTGDGRIYRAEQVAMMGRAERGHLIEMELAPTPAQLERMRVGRNDPCPCGSGRKFKVCHLRPRVLIGVPNVV
jgi:uncharacterized protein YecA (UPF0149 family)